MHIRAWAFRIGKTYSRSYGCYHPSDFPVGSQEYKDLTTNLKKLFTQIPKQVAPYNAYGNNSGGPLWISLQDHVGSELTDPAFNRTGAAQWFNYLKTNFPFKNLTMNVELFLDPTDPNASPSPAPCQEIYDREQFYVQQGINRTSVWITLLGYVQPPLTKNRRNSRINFVDFPNFQRISKKNFETFRQPIV